MSEQHHVSATEGEPAKIARELMTEGAEGEESERRDHRERYDPKTSLSFAELMELWHYQHGVAMHKERLYVPSSLAILIGTILGWKDVTATVVFLGAIASVGLYAQLVLIMEDFAARQDRFFNEMKKRRPDILQVMFDRSSMDLGPEAVFHGPPTVQRKLRLPFLITLSGVWVTLFLLKAGVFA
jgi:hypothetical protein